LQQSWDTAAGSAPAGSVAYQQLTTQQCSEATAAIYISFTPGTIGHEFITVRLTHQHQQIAAPAASMASALA
jgi:hypothetical protein